MLLKKIFVSTSCFYKKGLYLCREKQKDMPRVKRRSGENKESFIKVRMLQVDKLKFQIKCLKEGGISNVINKLVKGYMNGDYKI